MFQKLTMGRILVILHIVFVVLTVVGLFVAYVNNSLPHAWQPTVAAGLGIVSALAGGTTVVIKYLSGSQAIDQQQHEQALARIRNEPILPKLKPVASGQVATGNVATGGSSFTVSGQPDTGTDDHVMNSEAEPTAEDLAVPEELDQETWLANRTPATAAEEEASA